MASSHSEVHAGLQTHSMGGAYPWSIQGLGDDWQAVNLLDSNERGPRRDSYGSALLDIPEPYRSAELRCEAAAKRLKERNDRIAATDREIIEDRGQTLYEYLEEIANNGY